MTSPAPQPADGKREKRDRPDLDTWQNGVEPPFHHWEDDHTALVHVLWDVEARGLTLRDFDEVASLIRRSRWHAATLAEGQRQGLKQAASAALQEGVRRRPSAMWDWLMARHDALRHKETHR